tara:strand:- start:26 stop:343 length:318 start_codon:yes stop_codon:yes gene_type:complete
MDLDQLESALAAFASHAPTSFPLHHVQVFCYVAQEGGCTYRDIEEALNLSNSTVSRTVHALGNTHRKGYQGMDLLELSRDLEEGRRFLIHLTAKGKALKRQLDKI